jgi:hypothetical protein
MEKSVITEESVWAMIHESARQIQDLKERQAETDRQLKETDKQLKETDRQLKETDMQLKEAIKETDKQLNKTDRQLRRSMKGLSTKIGRWSNNHGYFAEQYFLNSFRRGKHDFFGEKFDEIEKNLVGIEPGYKAEYDIVLINGKSVGIIEVKFKAHQDNIRKILDKAVSFRVNFPKFANHQILLGLASFVFSTDVEDDCIREGIAIIKQVGKSVVINCENLKKF